MENHLQTLPLLEDSELGKRWDYLIQKTQPTEAYLCSKSFITMSKENDDYGIQLINDTSSSKLTAAVTRRGDFLISPRTIFSFRLKTKATYILGSQTISEVHPNFNLAKIAAEVLKAKPRQAIVLQAVRKEMYQNTFNEAEFEKNGLRFHIVGDWQPCLKITLSDSIEEYNEKISRKKRYNLNRQIKQMATALQANNKVTTENDTQLPIIEEYKSQDDVPELLLAIEKLNPEFLKLSNWITSSYPKLAQHGLLYCLRIGDENETIAIFDGRRYADTLYITKIFTNPRFNIYSPSASSMHLVIQHLISNKEFKHIDFGYGQPGQKNSTITQQEYRGKILIVKRHSVHDAAIFFIKNLIKAAALIRSFRYKFSGSSFQA